MDQCWNFTKLRKMKPEVTSVLQVMAILPPSAGESNWTLNVGLSINYYNHYWSHCNWSIPVRPVVHVPVQKVNASPGRKVQIECNIESYPRADVSWEFTAERGEPPLPILSDNKWVSGAKYFLIFSEIIFRYTKEEFLLSEYTTRTVLSIKNFTKEVTIKTPCVLF